MKVLITMMGPSTWGMFNSIWADIKNHSYTPDRVYILTEEEGDSFQRAKGMIKVLLERYGSEAEVIPVEISNDNIQRVRGEVRKIGLKEKEDGNQVALDLTPGRKGVVLGSVFAGWAEEIFDKVFYLYIRSLRNASRPYVLIPFSVQHPHEIIGEGR